jgi:ribosomal protein S13
MAGRPTVEVEKADLEKCIDEGHTKAAIARIVGVSRTTLDRLIVEHNLGRMFQKSILTDQQIDEVTKQAKEALPFLGERMILGYFASKRYIILLVIFMLNVQHLQHVVVVSNSR